MFIIISVDQKDGFIRDGKLPWKVLDDLNNFQAITTTAPLGKTNVLIMGVNTWNTIPNLKKRICIVVTTGRTPLIKKEIDPILAGNLKDALNFPVVKNSFRTFVIGGARLVEEAFPLAEGWFITQIHQDYQCNQLIKIPEIIFRWSCSEFNMSYTGEVYSKPEDGYLGLLNRVLKNGEHRLTRNGLVYSVFSDHLNFDLTRFPLLTTKRMFLSGIVEELLMFLRGETQTRSLSEKGIRIWEPNTCQDYLNCINLPYQEGDMGPMYGYQWRNYGGKYISAEDHEEGLDTFENLLNELVQNPTSRRLILSSLNMNQVNQGVLWPCHGLVIQFYVQAGRLSCQMYQRSADVFLGLPFNIASYALLVEVICVLVTNRGRTLTPGHLHICLGDVHLYEEHVKAAIQQLVRPPFDFPRIQLVTSVTQAEDIRAEDFVLSEYTSYPTIKAKMIA